MLRTRKAPVVVSPFPHRDRGKIRCQRRPHVRLRNRCRTLEFDRVAILQHLGNVGDAEIKFLRGEFERPCDVRELAWSVPLGLEDQVYAISLMAIRLDQNTEAQYLGELAHGLRLSPGRCNEIHRRYNAPEIFQ